MYNLINTSCRPETMYTNTSTYYSSYHADYWHVFSLDDRLNLQVAQEFFLKLHEDIIVSEIYVHWKECANANPINPQYDTGVIKNGMQVANGFCRSAPIEKSPFQIIHSLSGDIFALLVVLNQLSPMDFIV